MHYTKPPWVPQLDYHLRHPQYLPMQHQKYDPSLCNQYLRRAFPTVLSSDGNRKLTLLLFVPRGLGPCWVHKYSHRPLFPFWDQLDTIVYHNFLGFQAHHYN